MTQPRNSTDLLRVADLAQRRATPFSLSPDAAGRQMLADALGVQAIRKLTFQGQLSPEGARDWRLDAELGTTAVQTCVVTLAPVVTRIDQKVTRRFLADFTETADEDEIEMPEDETVEALGESVDLARVMAEALALALPDYPRAEGAELGNTVFAPPGSAPLQDADLKPFAGLAALKSKLEKGDE